MPFKSLSKRSVLFHSMEIWLANLHIPSYSVSFDHVRKCLRACSMTDLPPHAAHDHILKRGHIALWPIYFYLRMPSLSPSWFCADRHTDIWKYTNRKAMELLTFG